MASRRVLVTGADGVIGRVVRERLADRYELTYLTRRPAGFPSHVADIADLPSIEPAFRGIDAVVHLAASASVDSTWDELLPNNIVGTYNVFEAARRCGARRVVFASSNHAVGMYELEGAPAIYEPSDGRRYDVAVPVRPDSLYGVSKVFGEVLGRFYADRHGMDVVCLRIGSVRRDDDPTRAQPGRPFEFFPELDAATSRRRASAAWLSHRDCAQLIASALDADVHWAVVYGISRNPGRFWDIDDAKDLLGYEPEDAGPG